MGVGYLVTRGADSLGQSTLAEKARSCRTVVVDNGRVCDQFTGAAGIPIDGWKALWTDGDAI